VWRLLTVESESMGTHRVHMKGVLSWLLLWARRAGTIDLCPALAALVGLVQNIGQQPGQAVVLGRLSLCVFGRRCLYF
jgi:hypothetical protein